MIEQNLKPGGGTPFNPSASVQTALIEGVSDYTREKIAGLSDRIPETEGAPACIVRVTNTTTADRVPGDIVAVTASAITDWDDFPREAARAPVFVGSTPSKVTDIVAVLVDEIRYHASIVYVGRAVIAGVTVCLVDIKNANHKHAFPNASATKLTSAAVGPIRILSRESAGTGEKLCKVLLQSSGEHVTKIKVTSATADANGDYPAIERLNNGDGTRSDGAVCRYRIASGSGDSVVVNGLYDAMLSGTSSVSGTPYVVYDGEGNDSEYVTDCDDEGTDGYRRWKVPHPWEVGDFVAGDPP